MRPRTVIAAAAAGAAALGYASVIERNWFALRRYDVPVLPQGVSSLRILHLSDAHLTPGRHRLLSWIRSLAALEPDLVVNTGDSIAHRDAVGPFIEALGPLLDKPGVFVYGSNDLYAPTPKNPARYLWRTSKADHSREAPNLPWAELGAQMSAAGWLDANNRRGRVKAGQADIEVAGVHDSHIDFDRYEHIAGPADPGADLRLGVMHSPEPGVLDRFAADGYDLLLAGHTHGGQLCLPGAGALVTNCGIDRARARGLHHHPAAASPGARQAWLHVSAGLGTSPWAPARFSCRPEAALLTLLPRIS
ncbi:MAG TPA: metallophosphoesterase [Streptosporangiaceae bacterium]|jgi:predicted MPP superfamily phosphohydrolase